MAARSWKAGLMSPYSYQKIFQWKQPFRLTMGGVLPEFNIAYETWGTLNEDRSNAILLFTGLSANAHAHSHDRGDVPGWWEAIIGEGIDTRKYFVICFNHLGGCFGSTGPNTINPITGKHYGPDFPAILIGDIVEAFHKVVRFLGIEKAYCALGASMGGMLAMEYAARFPDAVERMIMISASGRPGPQSIAFRYVQRQVILHHEAYAGGWYYDNEVQPTAAMAVARQVGNITYRSRREFNERFGRTRTPHGYAFGPDFQVESYLHHMGWKLGGNYDANSFMVLSKAMDLFSLGYEFPTYEQGVMRIKAKCLIIGVSTDLLFPIDEQEAVYRVLRTSGRDATFNVLDSSAGHDAFLVEVDYFNQKLSRFLEDQSNTRKPKVYL